MSEMASSLIVTIDPKLGGVLLANMLETWLDGRADFLSTAEVTDELEDHNREGHVSSTGKPYTRSTIRWIRWRHQIPAPALKRAEELTVQQVAKHFDVREGAVYYWIENDMIQARRFNNGTPYWITFSAADEQKLRDWVQNSSRIHTGS